MVFALEILPQLQEHICFNIGIGHLFICPVVTCLLSNNITHYCIDLK